MIRICLTTLYLLGFAFSVQAAEEEVSPLAAYFPETLINSEGDTVPRSHLEGKLIGIYFSAGWCGPCRQFTPILKRYHEANKDDFEVVFVSSDRSAKEQAAYMKKGPMPWPAIEFQAEEANALEQRFQVRGIPYLVLIKPDGSVLSTDGRSWVTKGTSASDLKKATLEIESFKCGYCSQLHKREKLVLPEE